MRRKLRETARASELPHESDEGHHGPEDDRRPAVDAGEVVRSL